MTLGAPRVVRWRARHADAQTRPPRRAWDARTRVRTVLGAAETALNQIAAAGWRSCAAFLVRAQKVAADRPAVDLIRPVDEPL